MKLSRPLKFCIGLFAGLYASLFPPTSRAPSLLHFHLLLFRALLYVAIPVAGVLGLSPKLVQ